MTDFQDNQQRFQIDGYDLDIIVTGYPGRSVCHGSLGWSTIVLIRHEERLCLIDVGSFGQRGLLLEHLEARGLKPSDVTDVLLTHSHYDHSINWTMFPDARIVISATEMDWALKEPWGITVVPELYVEKLDEWPTVERVEDGAAVFPGITAHEAPGHTPGCLVFVLESDSRDVIFTGDAAKNRAELLSRSADMTYDEDVSRASIEAIWNMWRRRPGNLLIPGHDVPMLLEDDAPRYIGDREAAIRAWFDPDLTKTTVINIAGGVQATAQAAE